MLSQDEIQALRDRHYNATLTEIFELQKALWIIRVTPDKGLPEFKPGQYTTLGLGIWEKYVEGNGPETLKPGQEKQLLRRAYSMSHPILNEKTGKLYSEKEINFFEYYVTLVLNESQKPAPPRLTPRVFALKKGDRIALGPKVTGHYILEDIKPEDQIVFFATGTGEAPHNAMIWQLLTKGHKGPIVSCVCTRYRQDQAYRKLHENLTKQFSNYHVIYLATREEGEPKMYCQDLVQKSLLEKQGGVKLNPANTHIFLCGNPSMIGRPEVKEGVRVYPKPVGMIEILEGLGFSVASPSKAGNIHFEAYW